MAKATKLGAELSVMDAEVKSDTLSHLKINQDQRDYATAHGLNLNAPAERRWEAAVEHQDAAKKHFAALGLVMLSLKADLPHGEFQREVEARGFEVRQTQRAMGYAQFVFSRPKVEQGELLKLSQTKVCTLAAADPEVIELVMQEGIEDMDASSVREFRQKIAELKAKNTDLWVQMDAVEAERDGALKRLNKRHQHEDDVGVPVVMADIRAEAAALVKKAELALESFHPLGGELMGYVAHAEAGAWVQPTGRMVIAGLMALRVLLDGHIADYVTALGVSGIDFGGKPDALSFLQGDEVDAISHEWADLTALHSLEEALRKHERNQARPRGKGRPPKAPEAPKAKSRA